jgi:ATP-dependent helicase HrpB
MLLQAEQLGCLWSAAGIAALLAEGDIVRAPRLTESAPVRDDRPSALSDMDERLEAIDATTKSTLDVDRNSLGRVVRTRRELFRAAKAALGSKQRSDADDDQDESAIRRALLAGFPDRVARRRQPGSDQAVMVGGRGVVLARSSVVREAELFVAIAVDGGDKQAGLQARQGRVLIASAIERQWLPTREDQRIAFDEKQGRVVASERWLYEDLCLEQRAISPDPDQAASLLAEYAAADIERALSPSDRDRAWLARARFVRHHLPGLDLPPFDAQQLRELLPTLCIGKHSIEQLREVELGPWLTGQLTPEQVRAVERAAPERIEVPSGARIRLQYREPHEPPVLAVQLQQMFGLADTPRVAGGKVPVLLHLLAPNLRPVQVTQDLRSFWDVTYAEVRRELRRRYPKHAWPEDPWTASPERRPRRR